MKRIIYLLFATGLLLTCSAALGQSEPAFPSPAFHWKCQSSDSLLNFHPATVAPLHFDSIPYAEDYTIVVVYKPIVDTEALVWRLVFADSGTTLMYYDNLGQLLSTTDPEGFSTFFEYDLLGRMRKRTHPDANTTKYDYDNAGNLMSEGTPLGEIFL